MNRIVSIMLLFALATSFGAYPTTSSAAEPTVLIMGEDRDEDSIPRKSQIFERVLSALTGQLVQEGFKVFDETMVTQGSFVQGRVRRTDNELFDIAKSIKRPPIDVVAVFKIFPRIKRLPYTTSINVLVTGRILNVSSGVTIGEFEVTQPVGSNVPKNCDNDCAIEAMGEQGRILGQELGAVLAIKLLRSLVNAPGHTAGDDHSKTIAHSYSLKFNNFTPDDLTVFEEYFVAFQGYRQHKNISESARHAEYLYETTSDDARFKRNLRKMLEYINIKARLACTGTKCLFDKI